MIQSDQRFQMLSVCPCCGVSSIDPGGTCRGIDRWPDPHRLFHARPVPRGTHDSAVDHRAFVVRIAGEVVNDGGQDTSCGQISEEQFP